MFITTKEIVLAYKDLECFVAVLIGMITQIFHTNIKTLGNYLTIIVSSIFMALTIVPFIIERLCIEKGSTAEVLVYSLSSLISVKIIVLLDSNLLVVIKKIFLKYIGVNDDKKL